MTMIIKTTEEKIDGLVTVVQKIDDLLSGTFMQPGLVQRVVRMEDKISKQERTYAKVIGGGAVFLFSFDLAMRFIFKV